MIRNEMSVDELLALPVSVDLTTAAKAFGIGRTKAYELAQAGEFPCRVIRVGLKYRVPRSALLEALGVDPGIVAAHEGAGSAA
ncbi:MAG: helix-turn-helix domain-containing protein [Streptosporangiaceae bacterium]